MIFQPRSPNKYTRDTLDKSAPTTSNAFTALQHEQSRTEHNCPVNIKEASKDISQPNELDDIEYGEGSNMNTISQEK